MKVGTGRTGAGARGIKRSEDKARSGGGCVAQRVMRIWAGVGSRPLGAQEACLSTQVPSDPAFQITGRALEVGLESPGEIREGTGRGTGIEI